MTHRGCPPCGVSRLEAGAPVPAGPGQAQPGFRQKLHLCLRRRTGRSTNPPPHQLMPTDLPADLPGDMPADQHLASRYHALLARLLDVMFGTVWWVREDVWQEQLAGYDQDSERMAHPGVSLRVKPATGLGEAVPLLHGTTSTAGPVVVRGLTAEYAACGEVTSFGRLVVPASLRVREFVTAAPDADPEVLAGPWSIRRRVIPNWYKLQLTPPETYRLWEWAEGHDLI